MLSCAEWLLVLVELLGAGRVGAEVLQRLLVQVNAVGPLALVHAPFLEQLTAVACL